MIFQEYKRSISALSHSVCETQRHV